MKRNTYGVSSKYNFGLWEHIVYVFNNKEAAQAWLSTEEYNFRERELMGKTAAEKLAGRGAVRSAINGEAS